MSRQDDRGVSEHPGSDYFVLGAPFGGLSCQVRAIRAKAHLDDQFAAVVGSLGGRLAKGETMLPVGRSLKRETLDNLVLPSGRALPVSTALWAQGGDEVLVLTVESAPFKRDDLLADDLVAFLVEAVRAIHRGNPIRAALIGEEGFAASRLLGLWGTSNQPKPGAPGTLWPDGTDLRWFPLTAA